MIVLGHLTVKVLVVFIGPNLITYLCTCFSISCSHCVISSLYVYAFACSIGQGSPFALFLLIWSRSSLLFLYILLLDCLLYKCFRAWSYTTGNSFEGSHKTGHAHGDRRTPSTQSSQLERGRARSLYSRKRAGKCKCRSSLEHGEDMWWRLTYIVSSGVIGIVHLRATLASIPMRDLVTI